MNTQTMKPFKNMKVKFLQYRVLIITQEKSTGDIGHEKRSSEISAGSGKKNKSN